MYLPIWIEASFKLMVCKFSYAQIEESLQSYCDNSLFVRNNNEIFLVLYVYVDDTYYPRI